MNLHGIENADGEHPVYFYLPAAPHEVFQPRRPRTPPRRHPKRLAVAPPAERYVEAVQHALTVLKLSSAQDADPRADSSKRPPPTR